MDRHQKLIASRNGGDVRDLMMRDCEGDFYLKDNQGASLGGEYSPRRRENANMWKKIVSDAF
jgi:hypothetical protein